MFIRLLQISLLMGLAVACGGETEGQSPESVSEKEPINLRSGEERVDIGPLSLMASSERLVEILPDLQNIDEFRSNINNHVLKFKVHNKNFRWLDISCRKDGLINEPLLVVLTPRQSEVSIPVSFDRFDKSLMTYHCRFANEGVAGEEKSFTFLRSHIVSGHQTLESFGEIVAFDSLLIDQDAVWRAGSGFRRLKVNQLVSFNGKIVTFTDDEASETPDGMSGASGAIIVVNADRAVGNLMVELRGKDGGRQMNIPAKNPTIFPRDPNTDGMCKFVESINEKGCEGRSGKKGVPGFTGFPGLNGGDTGSFKLKVSTFSFMDMKVLYFPGNGGPGGEGGEGSVGAPGGIGSTAIIEPPDRPGIGCLRCSMMASLEVSSRRLTFPDGPQGPKGDNGGKGAQGESGTSLESQVRLVDNLKSFISDWSFLKEYSNENNPTHP